MKLGSDQGRQTVETAAEVGRRGGTPDAHRRRERQHGLTPSSGNNCRSQAKSQSGDRRRTKPDGRSTSTGALGGGVKRRTGTRRGLSVAGGAGSCCKRRLQA